MSEELIECNICLANVPAEKILEPCHHRLCQACASQLTGEKCPFCRGTVENWVDKTTLELNVNFNKNDDIYLSLESEEPASEDSLSDVTLDDVTRGIHIGWFFGASFAVVFVILCIILGLSSFQYKTFILAIMIVSFYLSLFCLIWARDSAPEMPKPLALCLRINHSDPRLSNHNEG